MLTELCVMFFSPSRAVLNAILRDEYLTSTVRAKELFSHAKGKFCCYVKGTAMVFLLSCQT